MTTEEYEPLIRTFADAEARFRLLGVLDLAERIGEAREENAEAPGELRSDYCRGWQNMARTMRAYMGALESHHA